MSEGRTPTIDDVALLAGVSVATVSRALRGLPNVAPSTAARVREASAQLRYRPAPFAAGLAAGRTRTIAMGVPHLNSWYFAQLMAGAEAIFAAAGYDLLVFGMASEEARDRVLSGPLLKRADGMILVDLEVAAPDAPVDRMPIVTIGFELAGCSSVSIDDVAVGRMATEHLLALGHREIALLTGAHDDPFAFSVPRKRLQGYELAIAAVGGRVRQELRAVGGFSTEGGYEAMLSLLQLEVPPTAVFAMSDEMAFGALRALWEQGLLVPRDVSLVGVDDHEVSKVLGLTTVAQPVAEHGATAARLLLERLADPEAAARDVLVPVELVIRATTAPLSER
jgi:DNA-binding LacI/PurR family transcriptional regulator